MLVLPSTTRLSQLHRYRLLVDDQPDVLLRLVGLCQRRRARVVALTFSRATGDEPAEVELCVEATGTAAHQLPHWLGNLVNVRSVEQRV